MSQLTEKLLVQKLHQKLITNENDIKYLNLEATKVWDDQDNVEGLRPESIEFQLVQKWKAEGNPVALSAGSDWKVTFSNLPDKDSNGNLISYTVKEVKVPTYYTVDKEEAQFVDGKATITNKRTPETTEVTVKKFGMMLKIKTVSVLPALQFIS